MTAGIPFPRGLVSDGSEVGVLDAAGARVPVQVKVLDRWGDGSVRWALIDFQAAVSSSEGAYQIALVSEPLAPPSSLTVTQTGKITVIDTGVARFTLKTQARALIERVEIGGQEAIGPDEIRLEIRNDTGAVLRHRVEWIEVEEAGPLRATVLVVGAPCGARRNEMLRLSTRMHFFAGSPVVRFDLTLTNPNPAKHPRGIWTLGDRGSIYLREVLFHVATRPTSDQSAVNPQILCSVEPGAPLEAADAPLGIYQDSSGGRNWRSGVHVNRHGKVPVAFRGYRLRSGFGGRGRTGLRAEPIVVVRREGRELAATLPTFWQNFPKSLAASQEGISVGLFPADWSDVHELQGGEQKTHSFAVAFGEDRVADIPLEWCRQPLLAFAEPAWYCGTEAVPYLTPVAENRNPGQRRLVDAAIDGEDTFERKREAIDEYGWRNFGEIYADHESVNHGGPTPFVSHYNNQYDAIAGLACQFLMSGDRRWWTAMDELARHVADIDIYHTTHDKSAYNGGLFWHTFHYVDAGRSTHRSFPDAPGVNGGGPSNEHDYSTGLMLHYFLTGSRQSYEAVCELADWVVNMDEGRTTVFRWLDRGDTGLASSTRDPLYQGPGRGAGNSIVTLLNAWRLTGRGAYLAKAEQLIRRAVHPEDDIAARNLLDAENRWSYNVFLQTLGRYLHEKAETGELDATYRYARASLLHYARWMAEHEYPYLDKPEILEYPTETWAAQDIRKSDVFCHAALHTAGDERERFLERARFFFDYAVSTLSGMKTRTLARPVVLMLSNGWLRSWLERHPDAVMPAPAGNASFGEPQMFVPQKARALRRAKRLTAAAVVVLVVGVVALLVMGR